MPTLHDLLAASVEADAAALAGESAPREVRARIGAIRTRRAVVTGGGATLAVGAAAFAAVGGGASRSPLEAATVAGGKGTITIPLADATLGEGQPYASCGEPAPAPLLSNAGYTLDPGIRPDGGLHFSPRLTYEGGPYEAITVEAPEALVLSDGVVVASFSSGIEYAQVLSVDAGFTYEPDNIYLGADASMFNLCVDVVDADDVALAAGDYQVVLVQSVHRSAVRLAITDLAEAGYPVAPYDVGTWVPGSIDCDEAIQDDISGFSDGVPIQCQPFGVEGVTIDEASGTVTLPVLPHVGEGDVEVMLATEPIAWTLDEDLTLSDLGVSFSTGPEPGTLPVLACDVKALDWWGKVPEASTGDATVDDLLAPGGAEIALDIDTMTHSQQADITLADTMDAWILSRRGAFTKVTAHATATLGSGDLFIDRSVDYARTSLQLSDFAWCPEASNPLDDYVNQGWETTVLLETTVTVTGTDGDVATGNLVVVSLPEEDV